MDILIVFLIISIVAMIYMGYMLYTFEKKLSKIKENNLKTQTKVYKYDENGKVIELKVTNKY